MSKQWETKKKILKSLSQKAKTLTDLSNELDLSQATISQHLQELLNMGAIQELDDQQRKWRYYTPNPSFDQSVYQETFLQRNRFTLPLAIIAALAAISILYYAHAAVVTTPLPTCTGSSIFACSHVTRSSGGILSATIGGFPQEVHISGVGCSYNSSAPSDYVPANLSVAAGQFVALNITCPEAQSRPSSITSLHIWVSYDAGTTHSATQVAEINFASANSTTTMQITTTVTTGPPPLTLTTIFGLPSTTVTIQPTVPFTSIAPRNFSTYCIASAGYSCGNPSINTAGDLEITLGQDLGYTIYNVSVSCAPWNNTYLSYYAARSLSSGQQVSPTIGCDGYQQMQAGVPFTGYLYISYSNSSTPYTRSHELGVFQAVPNPAVNGTANYTLTFTEAGLGNNDNWTVDVGGTHYGRYVSTRSNVVSISLKPGVYTWSVYGDTDPYGYLARYTVSQPFGTINLTGSSTINEALQLQYGLCINVSAGNTGTGTTNPRPNCSPSSFYNIYWLNSGSVVNVSATPASGSAFEGWGCSGAVVNATNNPVSCDTGGPSNTLLTVKMDQGQILWADFIKVNQSTTTTIAPTSGFSPTLTYSKNGGSYDLTLGSLSGGTPPFGIQYMIASAGTQDYYYLWYYNYSGSVGVNYQIGSDQLPSGTYTVYAQVWGQHYVYAQTNNVTFTVTNSSSQPHLQTFSINQNLSSIGVPPSNIVMYVSGYPVTLSQLSSQGGRDSQVVYSGSQMYYYYLQSIRGTSGTAIFKNATGSCSAAPPYYESAEYMVLANCTVYANYQLVPFTNTSANPVTKVAHDRENIDELTSSFSTALQYVQNDTPYLAVQMTGGTPNGYGYMAMSTVPNASGIFSYSSALTLNASGGYTLGTGFDPQPFTSNDTVVSTEWIGFEDANSGRYSNWVQIISNQSKDTFAPNMESFSYKNSNGQWLTYLYAYFYTTGGTPPYNTIEWQLEYPGTSNYQTIATTSSSSYLVAVYPVYWSSLPSTGTYHARAYVQDSEGNWAYTNTTAFTVNSTGTTTVTTSTVSTSTTSTPTTTVPACGGTVQLHTNQSITCGPWTATLANVADVYGTLIAHYAVTYGGYSMTNLSILTGESKAITVLNATINVSSSGMAYNGNSTYNYAYTLLTPTSTAYGCDTIRAISLNSSQSIICNGLTNKLLAVGSNGGRSYAIIGTYYNGALTNETSVYSYNGESFVTADGLSEVLEVYNVGSNWAFILTFPTIIIKSTSTTVSTTVSTSVTTSAATTIYTVPTVTITPSDCNTYTTLYVNQTISCNAFSVLLLSTSGGTAAMRITDSGFNFNVGEQPKIGVTFTALNETLNVSTSSVNSSLGFATVYLKPYFPPVSGCAVVIATVVGANNTCNGLTVKLNSIATATNGTQYGIVYVFNSNDVLTNVTTLSPQWPTRFVNVTGHRLGIEADTIGSNWEAYWIYIPPN